MTGNIIIDDSVELHGNVTLESTGGRISITGAVDSVSGSTCSLTLTADDSVSIGGSVGGTHFLENLTIESGTGVTLSSTVTVTGSLSIGAGGAVDLNGETITAGKFSQ